MISREKPLRALIRTEHNRMAIKTKPSQFTASGLSGEYTLHYISRRFFRLRPREEKAPAVACSNRASQDNRARIVYRTTSAGPRAGTRRGARSGRNRA